MSRIDAVCEVRAPEGLETEYPCNCHPADRRVSAAVVRLGNLQSTHLVMICAETLESLMRQSFRRHVAIQPDAGWPPVDVSPPGDNPE